MKRGDSTSGKKGKYTKMFSTTPISGREEKEGGLFFFSFSLGGENRIGKRKK